MSEIIFSKYVNDTAKKAMNLQKKILRDYGYEDDVNPVDHICCKKIIAENGFYIQKVDNDGRYKDTIVSVIYTHGLNLSFNDYPEILIPITKSSPITADYAYDLCFKIASSIYDGLLFLKDKTAIEFDEYIWAVLYTLDRDYISSMHLGYPVNILLPMVDITNSLTEEAFRELMRRAINESLTTDHLDFYVYFNNESLNHDK